jgi:hypothetical protein
MKIKSLKFKKNSVLNKEAKITKSDKDLKDYSSSNNNAINDVEKIIKSPSLNISSKLDSKGN